MVITEYNDLMRNSYGLALLLLILFWNDEPFCIAVVVHVGIYLTFMKGCHFINMIDIIIGLGV